MIFYRKLIGTLVAVIFCWQLLTVSVLGDEMQNETSSATANNTNTTTTTSTTTTTTTTLAPSTVTSSTTPVPKNASKEAYTTDLINNRLVPADYNKNIRPNFGDNATVINMSLNINDVSSISENSMVSDNKTLKYTVFSSKHPFRSSP